MWTTIKYAFHCIVSPKKFLGLSLKLMPWLNAGFLLCFSYGLIGGLILAPADYLQGDAFRIIYLHVPAAFLSLAIYAVMAGAAVMYLIYMIKIAPLVIQFSAPIGAFFTLIALITGSLWGKPMWGTFWIWDARLTSELILLFLYLGILLFQSAVAHKHAGERATAVLVLIGFIDIPLIHYSVYWWNTLHQGATLSLFQPVKIASSMLYPLLAMIAAFLFYYGIVLFTRLAYEITATQNHVDWLEELT